MDRYGFVPYPAEYVTTARREELLQAAARIHHRSIAGHPPSEFTNRVMHDLVARCKAEGIAVAIVWAAESPRYRDLYGSSGKETVAEYNRFLTRELGAAVFPAPEHLAETDFADGYHLLEVGAGKYSRWLADTHLKPWLAGCRTSLDPGRD